MTIRSKLLVLPFCVLSAASGAAIEFTDVTASAGITFSGESFGAAWRDYDGDGFPDLWVSHHFAQPGLYLNNGDGSFSDIGALVVQAANPTADTHGAAWADFDNDGDADLLQVVGAGGGTSAGPNQLLVNHNGTLTNEAAARGLEYALGRGRTPLWFDANSDGLLDALLANLARGDGQAPTALLTQSDGAFVDSSVAFGLNATGSAFFAQISGVAGIAEPRMLIHAGNYPQRALRYDTTPMGDVANAIGLSPAVASAAQDVAIEDFDGNLEPDLLIVQLSEVSDVTVVDARHVRVRLQLGVSEQGVELTTDGALSLDISSELFVTPDNIYIGASALNPSANSFSVSPENPDHEGIAPHTPGVSKGVYVGRDSSSGKWLVSLSEPGFIALDFDIHSDSDIVNTQAVGFQTGASPVPDVMLRRNAGVYSDASQNAGLTTDTTCNSVVSGDFDNDMDADAYLVCRGMTGNTPNILLENLGDGSFVAVANAGGAAGSDEGRGDSAVVADYDLDGFLDIFTTNGLRLGNLGLGPDQLFRNNGNANHWLQLDLVGVRANRDAIGARVIALAGGRLQVRGQGGGIHRYSQDSNRLHFGLAANTKADALIVQWPNGSQQTVANMPADQVIQVNQRSAPAVTGQPVFTPGISRGVYLWRDGGGTWRLRVSGNSAGAQYTIRVVSAAPVTITGSVALEGNDALASNPAGFALTANVASDVDGVDFQLYTGATTLISVERDGIRDPRDLHVGASGAPLTPAGWVTFVDALPALPAFSAGNDLGLYIGRNASTINARWSADVNTHAATLLLLSGGPMSAAASVGFEAGDNLNAGFFNVFAQSTISGDADGLDVTVIPGTLLGLVYYQDTLFQSHRVNAQTRDLGLPNAYLIR